MKRAIFTYYNFQIDQKIPKYHSKVVKKYNNVENCDYLPLEYKESDGKIYPDQVIDYAINHLFYDLHYDTILILEVDCVPLEKDSLNYIFDVAEKNILVGNSQRSGHIENNEHVYIAPSTFCITKSLYEQLGKLSFSPSRRGDIAEEYTYVSEKLGITIEKFYPQSFIRRNLSQDIWDLGKNKPEYGIGTTYINKYGKQMFFHLFETRFHIWNEIFYDKCDSLLNNNNSV
jgi:hypothetical protein